MIDGIDAALQAIVQERFCSFQVPDATFSNIGGHQADSFVGPNNLDDFNREAEDRQQRTPLLNQP